MFFLELRKEVIASVYFDLFNLKVFLTLAVMCVHFLCNFNHKQTPAPETELLLL